MSVLTKLMGAVFLVCATTAVGINMSRELSYRVKSLEWFIGAIDEIGEKIRYTSAELAQIVGSIYSVDTYLTVNNPFSVTVKKCGICEQDEKIICEFFSQLGMGDGESQIKRCMNYKRRLMRQKEDADKQQQEKSRLYKMLGLFSGLGIAIVLV